MVLTQFRWLKPLGFSNQQWWLYKSTHCFNGSWNPSKRFDPPFGREPIDLRTAKIRGKNGLLKKNLSLPFLDLHRKILYGKKNHQGKKTTCCFEFTVSFNHKKIQNLNAWNTTPPEDSISCMTGVIFGFLGPCVFFDGKKKHRNLCALGVLFIFLGGGEREKKNI